MSYDGHVARPEPLAQAGLILRLVMLRENCPSEPALSYFDGPVRDVLNSAYRLPVADVSIGNQTAFAHALINGRAVTEFEPNGKAASELRKLFNQMEKVLWPAPALR